MTRNTENTAEVERNPPSPSQGRCGNCHRIGERVRVDICKGWSIAELHLCTGCWRKLRSRADGDEACAVCGEERNKEKDCRVQTYGVKHPDVVPLCRDCRDEIQFRNGIDL